MRKYENHCSINEGRNLINKVNRMILPVLCYTPENMHIAELFPFCKANFKPVITNLKFKKVPKYLLIAYSKMNPLKLLGKLGVGGKQHIKVRIAT